MSDAPHPAPWTTGNLVGLPAGLLASTAFNAQPRTLRIAGVRESHPGLFALLQRCPGPGDAQAIFGHYMKLAFDLPRTGARPSAPAEPGG